MISVHDLFVSAYIRKSRELLDFVFRVFLYIGGALKSVFMDSISSKFHFAEIPLIEFRNFRDVLLRVLGDISAQIATAERK